MEHGLKGASEGRFLSPDSLVNGVFFAKNPLANGIFFFRSPKSMVYFLRKTLKIDILRVN